MSETAALVARVVTRLVGPGASTRSVSPEDFATRLAHEIAPLCGGGEVGVVLLDRSGEPTIAGGSTTRVRDLETFGLERSEGSALDALRAGAPPGPTDLDERRWPAWGGAARRLGFERVHRFMLSDAGAAVGVLQVFGSAGDAAPSPALIQPLADLAAVHLTCRTELQAALTRTDQLEEALRNRSVIEQAKGRIAERTGVPMDSAFESLRTHARARNERVVELCESIAAGELDLESLNVHFFPTTTARRRELRERALARWRQARESSELQRARALASTERSVDLRVQVEHQRAQRERDAIGRAIDRHFRDQARTDLARAALPLVLVHQRQGHAPSTAADALAADPRLEVQVATGDPDTLGLGLVEQPDLLVILAADTETPDPAIPDDIWEPATTFVTRLRRYCPDSRALLVRDCLEAMPAEGSAEPARLYDAVVAAGDAPALVAAASRLCGLPEGRPM